MDANSFPESDLNTIIISDYGVMLAAKTGERLLIRGPKTRHELRARQLYLPMGQDNRRSIQRVITLARILATAVYFRQ